jgi:hypothetical protein
MPDDPVNPAEETPGEHLVLGKARHPFTSMDAGLLEGKVAIVRVMLLFVFRG